MSDPALHLSTAAEAGGFEPPVGCPTLDFKFEEWQFGSDQPFADLRAMRMQQHVSVVRPSVNCNPNCTPGTQGPTFADRQVRLEHSGRSPDISACPPGLHELNELTN